jgi:transposase IS116/IS110/IS902 family protein
MCITGGIERSGWPRSAKPEYVVERSDSMRNWTCCNTCGSKRGELLAESRKHAITAKLRQIPYLGPIRVALAVALIQTPHRFRTKRQLWAYSGLALETRTSAEYRFVEGQVRRSKKLLCIRGLNKDHNHDLKGLFKGAATMASVRPGPFQDFYTAALAKGIKPTMARLTLARKIAAITLTLWKNGENFDAEKLKLQAA